MHSHVGCPDESLLYVLGPYIDGICTLTVKLQGKMTFTLSQRAETIHQCIDCLVSTVRKIKTAD